MKIIRSSTTGSGVEEAEFMLEHIRESLIQPRNTTMSLEADNLLIEDDIVPIVMPGFKKEANENLSQNRKCECKFNRRSEFE
jgi:hypothetical protein